MHVPLDAKHPAVATIGVVLLAIALAVITFALADIGTAWVSITNIALR